MNWSVIADWLLFGYFWIFVAGWLPTLLWGWYKLIGSMSSFCGYFLAGLFWFFVSFLWPLMVVTHWNKVKTKKIAEKELQARKDRGEYWEG